MAEIILPPEEEQEETPQAPELNIDKPTENSKVITIEFEAKKTNKVSTKDTNQQLYTTDTDAWFEFKETTLENANGTYSAVFRNRHDGSIFQRTGDVVNGVAYYKIPEQEIRHAGKWRGQLVYTLENGNTTAREFGYDVKGHILDGKDVREIVVEDFETLMSQLRGMKENAESELANLVNTVEQNETNRQVFFDDLVEDIDELQANYQELLDTGVLQTNINTKLEALEEEYAPKLTEVTAQLAQTDKQVAETNFVDIAKNMNFFEDIVLVKTHDGGMQQFDIYLKNSDVQQKMTFMKPDDYFKLSGVRMSSTDYKSINIFASVANLSYTGNWSYGEPHQITYARAVGATGEYTFENTGTTDILFRHFSDNRGGVFRVTLNGSNPITITTYNTTSMNKETPLYNDVPEGTHTIKFEFLGDDADNPPSSGTGTSRGWLYSETVSGAPAYILDIIGEETSETGEVLLMSDTSNKEFAFSIAPVGGTNFQWIPQHATRTGIKRSEPIFILDGVQHTISDFNIGQEYSCKDFKFIQDIYGRNPDSGETNLVNVKTIHSVSLDGNINVSGSMKFLEDTQVSSSYVIMAPVNNELFDVLQTGWGNQYDLSKTDNSSTTLLEDADCGNYIYLSEEDYFVAYRHSDKRGNFGLGDNTDKNYHNFINHRDETIVKHYINIFDDQVLPSGYKYRWSGDYVAGRLNGAYELMSG